MVKTPLKIENTFLGEWKAYATNTTIRVTNPAIKNASSLVLSTENSLQ